MPSPRLDPDTRPMLLGAQIIPRLRADDYGRTTGQDRPRGPVRTRNGLPEPRPYRYQGTGKSMSHAEAAYWLSLHIT